MSEMKVLTEAGRDASLHKHDHSVPPMVYSPDVVNHPPHYTAGGVECIDAIAAATKDLEGMEGYCTGNIIKYLWRWKRKNGIQDLQKAQWYLNKLMEVVNGCTQKK